MDYGKRIEDLSADIAKLKCERAEISNRIYAAEAELKLLRHKPSHPILLNELEDKLKKIPNKDLAVVASVNGKTMKITDVREHDNTVVIKITSNLQAEVSM